MADINATISIISLNVDGLNVPIKRQRLSEWIKKQDPTTCHLPLNSRSRWLRLEGRNTYFTQTSPDN